MINSIYLQYNILACLLVQIDGSCTSCSNEKTGIGCLDWHRVSCWVSLRCRCMGSVTGQRQVWHFTHSQCDGDAECQPQPLTPSTCHAVNR